MKRFAAIFLILLLFLPACPKTVPVSKEPLGEIERFFPLKKGYAWSYLLISVQENQSSLIKTEVEETTGSEIKVNSNGSIFYYIIKDDGIMKKSAGYYILKLPLKKGSLWEFKTSAAEGRITITGHIDSLKIRDKEFRNCIITEEVIKGQNILLRTHYADGVGPVLIEQFAIYGENTVPVLRAELLGYSFDPSAGNQSE